MAFVLPITKTIGGTGTSLAFADWYTSQDGLAAGDYIVVVGQNVDGTNALVLTSTTGTWTRLDNIDSPRQGTASRAQVWWHKFDGTTLPDAPTASGNGGNWALGAFVVRDAPDVADQSWIDVNTRTDNASQQIHVMPSVTTTQDECLLIHILASTVGAAYSPPASLWGVDFPVLSVSSDASITNPPNRVIVVSRAQPTAGATPTYNYTTMQVGGRNAQIWTIAIRNKTNGALPLQVTNPPVVVSDFWNNGAFAIGGQISALHGTIDGHTTRTAATATTTIVQGLVTFGLYQPYRAFDLTPPASTTGVYGVYWSVPSSDYTAGLMNVTFGRAGTNSGNDDPRGDYHYFADASGNWSVYRFVTRTQSISYPTITVHLPDETRVDGSTTPPDLTAITRRGLAYRQVIAETTTALRRFTLRAECIQPFNAPLTITGGGASNPVNARAVATMLQGGVAWKLSTPAGLGLQVVTQSFQYGDGTRQTYVNDSVQALEYPAPGGAPGYKVDAGRQEIMLKASASDSMLLSAGTKGSATKQKFSIDAASSTSATYAFAGTFFGLDVTGKTGVSMANATFVNCGKIDAKGGSINNATIQGSVSTTAAARLEGGGSANGASFIKGAETYAIEIAGTGTVELKEAVYSGYTTPINVLATSGTVTIELAAADTQPTFNTAGATVVFSQPLPTQSVTVSNGVAGTLLLIQDITNPAAPITLYLGTPSSWPHTWTDSSPYVADRDIRVRAAFQSGVTAKIFIDEEIGTSTSTALALSYRLNQVDDDVYIANAIDGSTVTDIVIDDATLKIELDAPPGGGGVAVLNWSTIYAYEVYWLATPAGIIDEARIITAIDPANYLLEGPWKIKNVSSPVVPVAILGGFGRRPGGTSAYDVIDLLGGGPISPVADQIIAFATGSGVTPQDKTDIAAAVLAAAAGAPIAADIRRVNAISIHGVGTEADPFGPV